MTILVVTYQACFEDEMRSPFGASENFLSRFESGLIVNVILSFDIIIMRMNWTVYFGLLAGLLSASYSLISVLAQYKRISLAVRAGYFSALLVDPNRQVGFTAVSC